MTISETSEADAFAFDLELRRLKTPDACAGLFKSLIAPFGFDTFACGEIDLQDRDRTVFYIIEWPDRWRKYYFESGLVETDPVLDALERRTEPFSWSDLRQDGSFSRVGRKALELAASHGWTEGLVVPVTRGQRRVGLVSLVGHRDLIAPADRALLCLASQSLHTHVRSLVAREGFAAPPAGLTPREIECVRLVARGQSDKAIAQAMGIVPSTAHEFVEKAKRRLKASSRAEMIAIAVALGIIDI